MGKGSLARTQSQRIGEAQQPENRKSLKREPTEKAKGKGTRKKLVSRRCQANHSPLVTHGNRDLTFPRS